ncbi:hypothetical protein AMELA_G00264190 [Ameiurus melas]|uniref:Uncharacterized protein n=1 Tax=Ameiurus melas TaxID=219545 RepID=A0A7J5ZPE9_AMEME|nr:hypothetical protein AMELA_G00264190 [Ameiurus melas]
MLYNCFSSAITGALNKVDGIMNSYKYQSILVENNQVSASKLKMKRISTFSMTTTQTYIQINKGMA